MDDYDILRKIGDGTFGTVFLCRKRATRQDVPQQGDKNAQGFYAIKKMKRRYYNWDDCMKLREIKALKRMKHRNIVLLRQVIREDNYLYLVFEHMEENLYQLIKNQLDSFSEPVVRQIMTQLLEGLAYIHMNGLFHRDLKPENLLCRGSTELIKIADFGLTREIDSQPPYTEYIATRWYRAPELLIHSTDYNWPVDIWACGCIMGELYALRPLFPGRSELDQLFKICQHLGSPKVEDWPESQKVPALARLNFPNIIPLSLTDLLSGCSDESLNLIRSMLKWNPHERWDAKDLLGHEFFRKETS